MPAPVTTKKNKAQSAKVKKPIPSQGKKTVAPMVSSEELKRREELKRQVEYANKNPIPKGGGLEPTFDKPFWAFASSLSGGFGVRQSFAKPSKSGKMGSGMPDLDDEEAILDKFRGMRAKRTPPMGPVRKANTHKALKKSTPPKALKKKPSTKK